MLDRIKCKISNHICIFLFVISCMSVALLMLMRNLSGEADIAFHIRRILELRTSLLHGNILPTFSFNYYHGSLIMTLYPYLNLIPIVLISFFIKSLVQLVYIWYIINEYLALLISYFSSYFYNRSKRISLIFSIIYSLSTMFLTDGMDDFGKITSEAVLPLIIFGCFNIFKRNKYIELSLGITLIVYSSVPDAIIAICFCILWGILNITKITKKNAISIVKSCILTTLLTCLVWIPFVQFEVFSRNSVYTPAVSKSFYSGFSIFSIIKQVMLNKVTSQLSLFSIIGLFLGILVYIRLNSSLRKMLWISIAIIFLCSKIFPWQFTPQIIIRFFKLFQSPQRFYILPQIMLSYLFAVIVIKYINYNLSINGVTCFIIILAIFSQLLGQGRRIMSHRNSPIITRSFFNEAKNKGTHLYGAAPYKATHSNQFKYILNFQLSPCVDYYPKKTLKKSSLVNSNKAFFNNNTISIKHNGYNTFSFNSPKDFYYLTLPLIRYRGERLDVYLNHHSVNFHTNKNCLITLNNVKRGSNEVKIRYVPNIYLIILRNMMFLMGLFWIGYVYIKRLKIKR